MTPLAWMPAAGEHGSPLPKPSVGMRSRSHDSHCSWRLACEDPSLSCRYLDLEQNAEKTPAAMLDMVLTVVTKEEIQRLVLRYGFGPVLDITQVQAGPGNVRAS